MFKLLVLLFFLLTFPRGQVRREASALILPHPEEQGSWIVPQKGTNFLQASFYWKEPYCNWEARQAGLGRAWAGKQAENQPPHRPASNCRQ